jgi:hypothetical protein
MPKIKNINSIEPGQLYLAEELAPLIRVSERTMRRYCAEGFVKAKKLGGKKWVILGSDVFSFLDIEVEGYPSSPEDWPTEVPKEEGFYWAKYEDDPGTVIEPVELSHSGKGWWVSIFNGVHRFETHMVKGWGPSIKLKGM